MVETRLGFALSTLFALFLSLAIPSFTDGFNISFFAPLIVTAYYLFSIEFACSCALILGCFIDCIYLTPRLGFTGFTFLLTTLVLYPQKRFFFKDAFSTLSIMTFFFAFISSIIEAFLAHLFFSIPTLISFKQLFVGSLLMSLLDAAYAFLFFTLTSLGIKSLYRKMRI